MTLMGIMSYSLGADPSELEMQQILRQAAWMLTAKSRPAMDLRPQMVPPGSLPTASIREQILIRAYSDLEQIK